MRALIASDLGKRTERVIIKQLTEALLEAALSPSFLDNHFTMVLTLVWTQIQSQYLSYLAVQI